MKIRSQETQILTKKRQLLMTNPAGLGDRIVSILSLMELARYTNRLFEFYWQVNYRCGCKIDKLFDVPFKVSYEEPFSQEKWLQENLIPFAEILKLCKSQNEIVKLFGLFYKTPNNWCHTFKPVKEIENIVDTFAREHFAGKMIGVHIRRQDKIPDTSVETFIHEVELQLRNEPSSKVFLATDDGGVLMLSRLQKLSSNTFNSNEGVVDTFSKRFGDKLILYPRKCTDRSTQEGIIDGVVELLLLRKTDFVIGSACSKYSDLAAVDKPCILLGNNKREYLYLP